MTPKQLRQSIKKAQRDLRARVAAMPFVQEARRKRRIRRAALSSLLLLLLLFIRCDCGVPPVDSGPDAGVDAGIDAGVKVKVKATATKTVRPPLTGKVESQPRPELAPSSPNGPPWLDEFRMQVAARSPRLAQCFTGTERPGALRLSGSVNPNAGTLSDLELEPVGVGIDLSQDQQKCIISVLTNPVYRLSTPGTEGLPERVSLVIEF